MAPMHCRLRYLRTTHDRWLVALRLLWDSNVLLAATDRSLQRNLDRAAQTDAASAPAVVEQQRADTSEDEHDVTDLFAAPYRALLQQIVLALRPVVEGALAAAADEDRHICAESSAEVAEAGVYTGDTFVMDYHWRRSGDTGGSLLIAERSASTAASPVLHRPARVWPYELVATLLPLGPPPAPRTVTTQSITAYIKPAQITK
ncbi:hypothetical protein THASP1DRAFT_27491 [Thamnocephalis sphaerospora]|uniref:Uncharacterized protein n=1 Tax=Thamnocephalis sphaerospora TaxID=78915 RepID=A0A4P9XWT6_9FUNG|nr:hypothetical protein THASP1DRAFT_27491 [Thamnocephalis sphaerospora]|eukprot:RKP10737.1 hypothetical protein THASP1DRAFT_27491 [Thamnocephalis sphaerospora]